MEKYDLIIVGGGVAGMMLACSVHDIKTLIIEKNEKLGKKMFITGKGRCNVTNACESDKFFENVVSNSKFMFSSFNNFSNCDTMSFFEDAGVSLKIERGERVFPQNDKSSDVISALERRIRENDVTANLNEKVLSIKMDNYYIVNTDKAEYSATYVAICTGGLSYKATGSTGDGYLFAKMFGHTIKQICPALVPINLKEDVSELAGLSLKNVSVCYEREGNKSKNLFGEMLFTHKGVSGPIVLSLSSLINREELTNAHLCIDLKPALSDETLKNRIEKDIVSNKKQIKTALASYLPKNLIDIFLKYCKLDSSKQMCLLNKSEILTLVNAFKCLKFNIDSFEDINAAIITSGGVNVNEINPKTLMSKLVPNLFFAGEVLDVDALTGGFNIQIALSTAHAVASAINQLNK